MTNRIAVCLMLASLSGCSRPIAETSLDDPLPPPPVTLVAVAPPPARAPVAKVVPAAPQIERMHDRDPAPHAVPAGAVGPSPNLTARREPTPVPMATFPARKANQPAKVKENHYHRDFATPGDHVLFSQAGGSEQIWVAPDRRALSAYDDALRRGDRKGMQALRDTGALRFVPANTKGIILEVAPGLRKVRIAEGALAGVDGWIGDDYLRAEPDPALAEQARRLREQELARRKDVRSKKDEENMKAMMEFFGIRLRQGQGR